MRVERSKERSILSGVIRAPVALQLDLQHLPDAEVCATRGTPKPRWDPTAAQRTVPRDRAEWVGTGWDSLPAAVQTGKARCGVLEGSTLCVE